jgi:hypothetical protein
MTLLEDAILINFGDNAHYNTLNRGAKKKSKFIIYQNLDTRKYLNFL